MVSRIASLHFAPTEWSRQNLLREGIPDAAIHVTGNTVIDALLMVRDKVLAADAARWRSQFGDDLNRVDFHITQFGQDSRLIT